MLLVCQRLLASHESVTAPECLLPHMILSFQSTQQIAKETRDAKVEIVIELFLFFFSSSACVKKLVVILLLPSTSLSRRI